MAFATQPKGYSDDGFGLERYKSNQRRIMCQSLFSSIMRAYSGIIKDVKFEIISQDIKENAFKLAIELVGILENTFPTEFNKPTAEEEIKLAEKELIELKKKKDAPPF